MTERLLQFIWQFQYFTKSELSTTAGELIQIIYPGQYNTNQGPDFGDAKIKIGKTTWAGTVELHINTSDWTKHNHQQDKNYNNVILHVVWEDDNAVVSSNSIRDTLNLMRIILLILMTFIPAIGKTQTIDSTWLTTQYLPRFYTDTGTYLPAAKFINEEGHEKTLADFRGKILYVDIWATWCGNCLVKFPYQEQLLKRLKVIHLDTSIQIINISIEDTKSEWKRALKKYNPIGINLYSSDTSLYTKWNIKSLPAYLILDSTGKVLGKDITEPDEPVTIDYLLYAANKGITPIKALWTLHKQLSLFSASRNLSAFTDKDFAEWYSLTIQSFIDSHHWQQEHLKKKNVYK